MGLLFIPEIVRDWIVSARMERVTTADAFQRPPATEQHTVTLERLDRVFGATGMETATPAQQRTDGIAVPPEHPQQQSFHD